MVGGMVKRRRRVVMHLLDDRLPRVEGILVGRDRVLGEYRIAVPELQFNADAVKTPLSEARELRIPRERVAFYEVVR